MGTNYYRIPTVDEMADRKVRLQQRLEKLDMEPGEIERSFRSIQVGDWEYQSPWDEFVEDTAIHLGKRSGGWKFCWNFHKNKHYSNKEELLAFIRSGRVVDEYGDEWDVDKFIKMALEWGQPEGLIVNEEYRKTQRAKGHGMFWLDNERYDDLIIDGLRVSSATEFS